MFTKHYTVGSIIRNSEWSVPQIFVERYDDLWQLIREVAISEKDEDDLVWTGSINGD